MAHTHDPRRLQINPAGGAVEIILKASGGDTPEEFDFLRPTLSHVNNTGNHILKPVLKEQGVRQWEIPSDFIARVETVDGLNIKLRRQPPPPPTVKFSLAVYVLSRTGASSVIYADLFVRQDGKPVTVLGRTSNPERFGGLPPRTEYTANLELYLSHP